MLRTILSFLVLVALAAGDAPTTPNLPADATQALKTYAAACAAADKVAEQAKDRARLAMLPALKRAQDAATKRGDLDAALAIKAEIEKAKPQDVAVKDEILTMANLAGRYKVRYSQWNADVIINKASGFIRSDIGQGGVVSIENNERISLAWDTGGVTYLVNTGGIWVEKSSGFSMQRITP